VAAWMGVEIARQQRAARSRFKRMMTASGTITHLQERFGWS
jgi:hypothetical protein